MSYLLEPVSELPAGYFPDFYRDIFNGDAGIRKVYPHLGLDADWDTILRSRENFSQEKRNSLVSVLQKQYGELAGHPVADAIASLKDSHTYTVTTGQQIHIFLGPLYVLYKAVTAISAARYLSARYPDKRFVPIFWMATEDHDKQEINHVRINQELLEWDTGQTGPVGRFHVNGLESWPDTQFKGLSDEWKTIFKTAYQKFGNLADATRYLIHQCLGNEGLVVVDADDAELKNSFREHAVSDMLNKNSQAAMELGIEALKQAGMQAVLPAKNGNFFLFADQLRQRVDVTGTGYKLKETGREISASEMNEMLETQMQNFSPNVAFRPLYQEHLLPNLAYIAGPGEMQYWLQLTPLFRAHNLPVPALIPRNSYIFLDAKNTAWLQKNEWKAEWFFEGAEALKNRLRARIDGEQSLSPELVRLQGLITEINARLYAQNNPDLKPLKQLGEEYARQVKKAEQKYTESIFEVQKNREKLDRLLRIYQMCFDPAAPQERNTDLIQQLIRESGFISNFLSAPLSDLTNLYIAKYNNAEPS